MKKTPKLEAVEYPHGTPLDVVFAEELERDQSVGVQLWRHVVRRLKTVDRL